METSRWPSADPGQVLSVETVPAGVARIRRFAVAQCAASGTGVAEDTVALLVSEVATNAMVHGNGRVDVRVLSHGRTLRVEVADSSPDLPRLRRASELDEGGRGLALVDALATSWGAQPDPNGKTVWFELVGRD